MPVTHTLSDVITEYLAYRANRQRANTVKSDGYTLRRFLAITGNFQVKHVTPRHVDAFFAERGATCSDGTLNVDLGNLQSFFKWCRQRRLVPTDFDPLVGRKAIKAMERDKLYVPAAEFPGLLDAADNPRDRILVATGLYCMLRQSEVTNIRMSDIDLDAGFVGVQRLKVRERDRLPIFKELDREIRRWLMVYRTDADVSPFSYLTPAINRGIFTGIPGRPGLHRTDWVGYKPNTRLLSGWKPVQRTLSNFGYTEDQIKREGGHTLRRSGARAYYDVLSAGGETDALRTIQTWLGHKTLAMTEHYLGLNADKIKRDTLARGRSMLPDVDAPVTDNVVDLRVVSGGEKR